MLDLGPIAIETVTQSPTAYPPGLQEDLRPKWEVLWEDAETKKEGFSREFERKVNALGLAPRHIPSVRGHTYVVRAILPGEHDHLVAFSPVEEDEHGQTLVWRILKTWPVEARGR